jgi:hypothetical protein
MFVFLQYPSHLMLGVADQIVTDIAGQDLIDLFALCTTKHYHYQK